MAIPALLGAAAKGLATGMAKDKAKNFITGKKKTVKPDAIKKETWARRWVLRRKVH